MAVIDSQSVNLNTQLLTQLQNLMNQIVTILDGEAKLVQTDTSHPDPAVSLITTDNIAKFNQVLSDTLEAIDQVVLSEQTVVGP